MKINEHIVEHNTDPAQYAMLLIISATASSVTVKAGTVVSQHKEYKLEEDATFDIPSNAPADWEAHGHLVIEKTTGKVSVLVEDGGIGTPNYSFSDGPYDRLFPLWHLYNDGHLNVHNYGVAPKEG